MSGSDMSGWGTGSRDRMLRDIREALGRGRLPAEEREALERRLRFPRANVVPARGQRDGAARIDLFIAEAERVNATTERLDGWHLVPAAVAAYLSARNLPMTVRAATDPAFAEVPWADETTLSVTGGAAEAQDLVSVTSAFAGIAETGTLMLLSGPASPTSLNFLPADHLVAIAQNRIVGTYEDAWMLLRAEIGVGIALPRVINWITGPSRTADIEQTLLLGAHGPRRLHIMVVSGHGVG
jgi:L-lactate dehydrogenase complex protein LldG